VETANLDGSGPTVLRTVSNTVDGGEVRDEVISASGNVTAEVAQSFTPSHTHAIYTPEVIPGTCVVAPNPFSGMVPASMTISNDGAHAAFVLGGQIFNCESAVTPLNELNAQDVELSGDGTRMIFSAGPSAGARAAIWISDASGANPRPVFAPRAIYGNGIVGLGSYSTDILPPSPGSYFTIYGTNLVDADALVTASTLPLPPSLAGASVMVNGTSIPVQAVTPWQINALLPQEIAPGKVTVTIQLADGTSRQQTVTVAATAAAVDLIPEFGGAVLQAAAFHGATNILVDASHPAVAGEILATYGFGLGITTPNVAGGAAAPANPPASAAMPFVNVDGVLAQTTFAGLVPGFAGLYQVNVVVPAGLPPGVHQTHWYTFDSAAGPQGVIYTH
jgi:uncharacterized protein (TIGR03437 family)